MSAEGIIGLVNVGDEMFPIAPGDEPMNARERREALKEMRETINRDVAAGFRDPDDIVEGVVEMLADQYDEDELRPDAERLLRRAVKAHQRDQATWSATTDCDRLDAAFAELEGAGIVARQNFTCCQNCGHYEIGDEIAAARQAGREVHGYTFYHMQDTDSAVDGGGLYLAYGAVGKDGSVQEVGREIVKVLRRHKLKTKWNGSEKQRIFVSLDWKRRR
jgi:hypothetical protein